MAKRLYDVELVITEEEADTLAQKAGELGLSVSEFLSALVGDFGKHSDEGLLLEDYIERRRYPEERSFVAYCIREGRDPGDLAAYTEEVADYRSKVAELKADLKRGVFSEDDGYMHGVTADDVREDLEAYKEYLEDATKEKAEFWKGYLAVAGGNAMTEQEALKEAEEWEESTVAFKGGWRPMKK